MKIENDPFYQAFLDHSNGVTDGQIIICNADFDNDAIYVNYFFRDFVNMPSLEQTAMKYAKGRILDVGAGAGAHSLHLQKLGFDVTSIDSSIACCEKMKERGLTQVVHSDIMNYEPSSKFDTLYMLMNGIGIAGTIDNLPDLLIKLKSLCNEGASIICDSSDLIYLYEDDNGFSINLNDRYYGEGKYEMIYGDRSTGVFDWLYIDYPLLKEIAAENGFKAELLEEGKHYDYLCKLSQF
ncbi:MAG: class I SAM-dependent methyltransferase [Bacteroidia bacterium]|nr:class I SAM-dependent methyltransferase [Bacteroidia bacterium]